MDLKESQILNSSFIQSGLQSQGVIRPKGIKLKKVLSSGLMLTSLVDCFTIPVVYLLVATSFGSQELQIPKDMVLPGAENSVALSASIVIRVEDGQYKINDESVKLENLSDKLIEMRGDVDAIVIQADKRSDYSSLNPVVLSSLQAGFKKIKFAVLQGDKG